MKSCNCDCHDDLNPDTDYEPNPCCECNCSSRKIVEKSIPPSLSQVQSLESQNPNENSNSQIVIGSTVNTNLAQNSHIFYRDVFTIDPNVYPKSIAICGHSENSIKCAAGNGNPETINLDFSSIYGGQSNLIGGPYPLCAHHSSIHGGHLNEISAEINSPATAIHAQILGGFGNKVIGDFTRSMGNYNRISPNLVSKPDLGTHPAYMMSTMGNQTEARNLASTVLGYNGSDDTEILDTIVNRSARVAFAGGTARAKRLTHLFGTTQSQERHDMTNAGGSGIAVTDVFASNKAGGFASYMRFADDVPLSIRIKPYGWLVTYTSDGLRLASKGDFIDGVTSAPTAGIVTNTEILDGNTYETNSWGEYVMDPTYIDCVLDYLQSYENFDAIQRFILTHDRPDVAIALGDAGLVSAETALYLNQYIHRNYAVRKGLVRVVTARTLDPRWVPVTSFGLVRVRISGELPTKGEFVTQGEAPGSVIRANRADSVKWRVIDVVCPAMNGEPGVVLINMTPQN